MALPIPVPPPVTIATLCLKSPGLKTLDAAILVCQPDRGEEGARVAAPPAGHQAGRRRECFNAAVFRNAPLTRFIGTQLQMFTSFISPELF